ncbi:MAG TPA: HU family DNA-binding protein [Polyangia bacterium]|jgi:integration host factor subunit beta|nr:HU family DNA-binding protein [Polyangia bacterium]
MTKSDLIDVLCETQKIPKGRAELLVQIVFESMEASLKRGERIEIRGFGSFELRSYRPYEGRNPRTGVRVSVQPKRLPFFKVGKELKERVNAGGQAAAAKLADDAPDPAPVTSTGPITDSGATGTATTTATATADPATAGTVRRATA